MELVDESGYLRSVFVTPMRYDSIPRESAMLPQQLAQLLPGDPAMPLKPGPAYAPAWTPPRPEQVALLGPRPGPFARSLEIGAGTGANLHHLAPGTRLYAVEPGRRMHDRLRRRRRGRLGPACQQGGKSAGRQGNAENNDTRGFHTLHFPR